MKDASIEIAFKFSEVLKLCEKHNVKGKIDIDIHTEIFHYKVKKITKEE